MGGTLKVMVASCDDPTKSMILGCRDAVEVVGLMPADASNFCLFLDVAEVLGVDLGFLGLDSLPSVAVAEFPLFVVVDVVDGSFFLRGFFGAVAIVVVLLDLARLMDVAELVLSTSPPALRSRKELCECGFAFAFAFAFACVAAEVGARDGDSGDFGGDERSGEEL